MGERKDGKENENENENEKEKEKEKERQEAWEKHNKDKVGGIGGVKVLSRAH